VKEAMFESLLLRRLVLTEMIRQARQCSRIMHLIAWRIPRLARQNWTDAVWKAARCTVPGR